MDDDHKKDMTTPTPWDICKHATPDAFPQYGICGGDPAYPYDHCIVKGDNAKNDAELIVRAVNNHEALVSALRALKGYVCEIDDHFNRKHAQNIIEEALRNA